MLVKSYNKPLTLIGGGKFSQQIFSKCLRIAPTLIAVDAGLNHLNVKKSIPKWVIGDLDSAKKLEVWKKKGIKIKSIQEQETTDFEKCLYSFNAPYFLANAFLGKRIDHSLATISTIVKMRNKKVILLGKKDILFHIENSIELDLKKGIRLSLFPIKEVNGIKSKGLKYDIKNVKFSPSNRLGTSNEVTGTKVLIELDGPGMIIVLPRKCFDEVIIKFKQKFLR